MPLDRKNPALTELIKLPDKRAIVTGGASGIGLAAARRLAEAGAVVQILDLNLEKGRSAAESLREAGYPVEFEACDVASEEEIVAAVRRSIERMGGLDILVNNAGIFPAAPLTEINQPLIDQITAVNLRGPLLLIREAARRMILQQSGGNIINLTSVDALHPIRKNMTAYDASKGGVLSLTRSLAAELAPENIRVNAVAPGAILTEGALADRNGSRAVLREIMSRIPLGRMGSADEVARVILFLASDLSAYLTGSLITVDGGFMVS